ncbi:hypothetical protein J5N97_008349 [Dioscorea zingiberensis]|uniref:Uncharacterized protein n=1 Tax=Dioscorea zingiberensis TaxID=325984 RepID=A0A9D5CVY7_9LILI|nr:hypothetical protein J5N97_008349 [Dioscorea zingiberensis]
MSSPRRSPQAAGHHHSDLSGLFFTCSRPPSVRSRSISSATRHHDAMTPPDRHSFSCSLLPAQPSPYSRPTASTDGRTSFILPSPTNRKGKSKDKSVAAKEPSQT